MAKRGAFAIVIASIVPLGLAHSQPSFQTLDLNVNQSQPATLDGKQITIQLSGYCATGQLYLRVLSR